MSDVSSESQPSLFESLEERATAEAYGPWLFYRRWQWEWRSWGQVADQVARGAALLRGARSRRLAFRSRLDPDAIATGLAIRAAGGTAVAGAAGEPPDSRTAGVLAPGKDAGVSGRGSQRIDLPACRSRLERWRPEPLELEDPPGAFLRHPEAAIVSPQDLDAEAGRFGALLPTAGRQKGRRAILCASPALDAGCVQTLLAWTIRTGAAWVLEPDPEAFLAAARWSRPTLLVAPAAELGALAAELGTPRRRRHLRLCAAIAAGGAPADPAPWAGLDVPVANWVSRLGS